MIIRNRGIWIYLLNSQSYLHNSQIAFVIAVKDIGPYFAQYNARSTSSQ